MKDFFYNELKNTCRAITDFRENEILRIISLYDAIIKLAHIGRTEGLLSLEDESRALKDKYREMKKIIDQIYSG